MDFIRRKTAGLVKTRTLVLAAILAAPILVYSVAGAVAVWQVGWMRWLWWLAPIFWAVAWLVAKLWPAQTSDEMQSFDIAHWTPRDQQAVEIVRRYQLDAESFSTEQLTDLQFYFNQAQLIANDLARHYRPDTTDPIADRTLPEILAACRLVADDLEELLLTSIPGSRMLTVKQWRRLSQAPKFVRQATRAFWASKILLNPFNLAQWGTSKVTNEKVSANLQTELLVTLYMRFVRQLGYYLIEMNSGRLRGGSQAYRRAFTRFRNFERMRQTQIADVESEKQNSKLNRESPQVNGENIEGLQENRPTASTKPLEIRIAVLGQRGSGKTTLIQALLAGESSRPKLENESSCNGSASENGGQDISGRQPAVLRSTKSIHSHVWETNFAGAHILLLDTPGYEPKSIGKKLNKAVQIAVAKAHAILLTLDSRTETWDADKQLLERIRNSFDSKANLKPPRTIGVIVQRNSDSDVGDTDRTNLPSSNVQTASVCPPEDSINLPSVIERATTYFGGMVDEFIELPVNPLEDPQSIFRERLSSALHRLREAARSNAILSDYEESLNRGKFRILFRQTKSSVKNLFSNWLRRDP
jgi:signal recognition particle receptor subunit beta